MQLILILTLWTASGALLPARSCEAASPVGLRVYVSERGAKKEKLRFAPLKIFRDTSGKKTPVSWQRAFKDPTFSPVQAEKKNKVDKGQKKVVSIRENIMYRLGPLKIRAKFRQPEVPFSKIETRIERLQEPIRTHFIDKIGKSLPEM